jgi:hypothetical protein
MSDREHALKEHMQEEEIEKKPPKFTKNLVDFSVQTNLKSSRNTQKLILRPLVDPHLDGFVVLSPEDAKELTPDMIGFLQLESKAHKEPKIVKFEIDENVRSGEMCLSKELYDNLRIQTERVSVKIYPRKPVVIDNATLAVKPISGSDTFQIVASLRKNLTRLQTLLQNYVITEGLTITWPKLNAEMRVDRIDPPIMDLEQVSVFDFKKPKFLTLKPDGAVQFNTILIIDNSKSMIARDLEVRNVKSTVERIKAAFNNEKLDDFLSQFKDGNNVKRQSGAFFAALSYLSEKARIDMGEIVSMIVFADHAEVMKVDNKPYVITEARSKKTMNRLVEDIVDDLDEKIGVATNMAEAIEKCTEIIDNIPKSKRSNPLMIILLTDGFDTSQRLKEAVVETLAGNENIVLHAVGLGPYVNRKELVEISAICGGEFFLPDNLGELLDWYSCRAKDLSVRVSETHTTFDEEYYN